MNRIIAILIISTIISCKKEINQMPVISMEQPIENLHILAVDSFLVKGRVTDDNEIKSIRISIVNSNLIPVSQTYSFSPLSKTTSFNFWFELNEIKLESGTYYLLVSASDELEKTNNYTKLLINEINKELTGVWTVSKSGLSSYIKKYFNETGENFLTVSDACKDISFNSFSSQLHILTESGNLQSIDISNKELVWEKSNLHNYVFPYYGNLATNSNITFVSTNIGDIYGYNEYGTTVKSSSITDNSNRPGKFFFHRQYLIVQEIALGSIPQKIELFFSESGQSMQYHSMVDLEIIDFSSYDENRILIWGNTSSKMKVCTLNISLQHLDDISGFPEEKVKSVAMVSETKHFFLCNNAIYSYSPLSFSISVFKSGITAEFIKYEPLTNKLYVVGLDAINIYDINSGIQISSIILDNPIIDLEFSYNK
ncbi:MAG: hypothetical protein JXR58_12780 [Bacteroidales bacterium]|nr:hypothetical protein [Bacteroidales bacterium]